MSSTRYKKSIAFVIGLSLITSVFFVSPRPVQAIPVQVTSTILLPSAVSTALSTGITAGGVQQLVLKEFVLDDLAFIIAKALLSALTNSLVSWIQSGFQGNPAFVDDLGGFLLSVDARVFEEFLGSGVIDLLCSPWKFDLQFALEFDFALGTRSEAQCTLDNIVENLDQFVAGDFDQGGWDGWFELTQRSNPYSDYLDVSTALAARKAAARSEQSSLLDFGSGFFSFETCSTVAATDGTTFQNCSITTPGKVIEQQLENVLGSGVRQLELADELNEIIAALFTQLVNQALSGAGGLLGL